MASSSSGNNSNDEQNQLIAKRNQIKANLKRFNDFVSNYEQSKFVELKIRFDKIQSIIDNFDAVQSRLEIIKADEMSSPERDAFENLFYSSVAEARRLIDDCSSNANSVTVGSNGIQNQAVATPISWENVHSAANVKLPAVNLPEFRGEYHKWLQFADIFSALIDNNAQLSDVQKLYYLQGCLKGEASNILQSLDICNENYPIAWELLKNRYENKRVIIEKHVQTLFELPALTKESHSSIRNLIDTFQKHLRSLKVLGEPTDSWDRLLVHLLKTKLDNVTKREWQEASISKNDKTLPTYNDFIDFLSNRCQLLESLDSTEKGFAKIPTTRKNAEGKIFAYASSKFSCYYCNASHTIYKCKKFLSLNISDRLNEVKRLKLCNNCLRKDHTTQNCKSSGCKVCDANHNSLLHQVVDKPATDERTMEASSSIVAQSVRNHGNIDILLSTAIILIKDSQGNSHKCRALLDSGSQSNFMSKRLLQILGLRTHKIHLPVTGINQNSMYVSSQVRTSIMSSYSGFRSTLSFLILDKITENVPNFHLDVSELNIPNDVSLADPEFHVSSEIDILLGAEIFWDILCVGQIRLGTGKPTLQKSKLGWIVSGPIATNSSSKPHDKRYNCNLVINNQSIQDQIERFWKLEECEVKKQYSREESECESIFLNTFKHDESGRFEVHLPIRYNVGKLGDSLTNAVNRFHSLERKLSKDEITRIEYTKFMDEYQSLGHMTEVDVEAESSEDKHIHYLPHHCVRKESSTTTKLRVVFDGSAKTSTGISLNDILMVGPTIQQELFSILIRFREHNYVITGDIAKMYRQVKVVDHQRDLQRIVWRSDPNQPLRHYRLNTVTYGTSPAAYLAIRCLFQVAIEHKLSYPAASQVITRDFYVDDVLTGAGTIEATIQLKHDLKKILSEAGFDLRKWLSNDVSILENEISDQENFPNLSISDYNGTKTLGLLWNPKVDSLQYTFEVKTPYTKRVTKRIILSSLSQIFDPLGLIGAATIKAKLIMQRLWQLKSGWDESVPMDIFTEWTRYHAQLVSLNKIVITRHALIVEAINIQLHGFCDASQNAYGACIYLRSVNVNGEVLVQLLCAKSRVAPLKSISLPRLELCGALLLARLYRKVSESLLAKVNEIFFWCDSTITLSWISAQPSTWTTFIANRVSEIQELTDVAQWHHIASSDNPADVISRGVEPSSLLNLDIWWFGPSWLKNDTSSWPESKFSPPKAIPEARKTKLTFKVQILDQSLFNRYSSLFKLQRVVAYCWRFYKNTSALHNDKKHGPLTIEELDHALSILIRVAQTQDFSRELDALIKGNNVPNDSKLISLSPFLDAHNIIRVGGRLRNSNISSDRKFPIVLASKHPLTKLIILQEHHRHLHAGTQAILAAVRLRFWPLNGRSTVRSVLRKCITCFKVKPSSLSHKMGDLPKARVVPRRPFEVVGIDFAGPINIKDGKLRNRNLVKAYICAFVCFSTKAVHLEIVGDLSTEAFLNSLKRFVSRRGLCREIYTDNATNFVGAQSELKQIYDSFSRVSEQPEFVHFLDKNYIKWHFIPSRSPHFGGLWESVIKSAKFHLRRILGNANLTFEGLYTIITQIEAALNSRPLTPISSDPNDYTALTPGHFLIGTALTALPQHDVRHVPENRLRHYKVLQKLVQHFWTRWSEEYLVNLQQRTKWRTDDTTTKLKPDLLVILRDENTSPLNWKLGRISELHPGPDGITRVVSIKTASGSVVRRAVKKICVLPCEND